MASEISMGNAPDKQLFDANNYCRDLAFSISEVIAPSILFKLISIILKFGNPQISVGTVPERKLLLTLKQYRVEHLA